MILVVLTLICWNQCMCRGGFGSFVDDPEEPQSIEDTGRIWLRRIVQKLASKKTRATTTTPASTTPAYMCIWKICSRPLNQARLDRFMVKDTNKLNEYNKHAHGFLSLGVF